MSEPELSRVVKLNALREDPVRIEANEAERAALAKRFGISAIDSLVATVQLTPRGPKVRGEGSLIADIVQACAISGEDFTHRIEEDIAFVFVPDDQAPDLEEIELEADDLDEIDYSGDSFDLGEAVAQSLGLVIDPYAEGPDADAAREAAGIVSDDAPRGPLAEALAALKRD